MMALGVDDRHEATYLGLVGGTGKRLHWGYIGISLVSY